MNRIFTLILACIVSFLIGILYTIHTVSPSYDDGFYLLSMWGNTWCYADDEYIVCDDYEWEFGMWYEEEFEYVEE